MGGGGSLIRSSYVGLHIDSASLEGDGVDSGNER